MIFLFGCERKGFLDLDCEFQIFTESAPLGQFSHRVAISVCLFVCAIRCSFLLGLSLALRSHDQFRPLIDPPSPQHSECGRQRTLNGVHGHTAARLQCNVNLAV